MSQTAERKPVVSMTAISKRFGDVVANDRLSVAFSEGEVHALLGENGAGKSTLMSVLSGSLPPDEGSIAWLGKPVAFRSPRDALELGIGMVHQHFRLVHRFTVAENLHIGWEESPRLVSGAELERRARRLAEQFELVLDPSVPVGQLSIGEQQRVEILRTLARGAKVLILDEPTAVLTPQEAQALFRVVRRLAADGRTIIFISHKLDEVLEASDRVTVLRAGRLVGSLPTVECDLRSLARMMVGRDVVLQAKRRRREPGEPVLSAEGLVVHNDRGLPAVETLDLVVRAGEIVGVAGVAGNGQAELAEALTGLRVPSAGRVSVGKDEDLTGANAVAFIRAGVGHVPEDRRSTGVVLGEPIWRSAVMKAYRDPPIRRGPFLRASSARRFADKLAASVELLFESVDAPVRSLSGGNAQRLVTGREMQAASRVLVAMHPTRGLDVGAIEKVHEGLLAGRAEGLGVLLISEDLDEVLSLSDRVLVMHAGRILGEFPGEDADREQVGLLMGGVTAPEARGG